MKTNMAASNFKTKIIPLLISSLTSLVAMLLQLHGIIMLSEIIQKKKKHAICAMVLRKRSYALQKLKRLYANRDVYVGVNLVELIYGGKTFYKEYHPRNAGGKTFVCHGENSKCC